MMVAARADVWVRAAAGARRALTSYLFERDEPARSCDVAPLFGDRRRVGHPASRKRDGIAFDQPVGPHRGKVLSLHRCEKVALCPVEYVMSTPLKLVDVPGRGAARTQRRMSRVAWREQRHDDPSRRDCGHECRPSERRFHGAPTVAPSSQASAARSSSTCAIVLVRNGYPVARERTSRSLTRPPVRRMARR